MRFVLSLLGVVVMVGVSGPVAAQERPEEAAAGFVNVTGAWGGQFGRTDYLPTGDGTEFKHPLVTGFAFGVVGGVAVSDGVFVIGNYEYTTASTREGRVAGALEAVEGSVSYHSIVAGLRVARWLGAGSLFAEVGAGIVLPFETELEYEYASPLAAAGITGTGLQTSEYNIGYGGHGMLGYELVFGGGVQLGLGLKLKTFQSNNSGKEQRLENFVVDFTGMPPEAVTTTIEFDTDGTGQRPTTYSLSDVRLQLALGYRF